MLVCNLNFWLRRCSPTSPNVCVSVCVSEFQSHYKTEQDSTRQYQRVPDSTRQYQTVQDSAKQYKTVQDNTRQYKRVDYKACLGLSSVEPHISKYAMKYN